MVRSTSPASALPWQRRYKPGIHEHPTVIALAFRRTLAARMPVFPPWLGLNTAILSSLNCFLAVWTGRYWSGTPSLAQSAAQLTPLVEQFGALLRSPDLSLVRGGMIQNESMCEASNLSRISATR